MSYNNYLQGELSSLSDDRRTIEYDNGDRLRWLGAALNPFVDSSKFSEEGLLSRAGALDRKNINNSDDVLGSQTLIEQSLGGTRIIPSDLTIGTNETEGAFRQRLAALKGLGFATSAYGAIDGSELEKIIPGITVQEINKMGTALKRQNKLDAEREADTKEQKLWDRVTGRQDDLRKGEIIREDRKDARQNLLLAQQKKDALELRRDNMNLDYARLNQADVFRAQDRRDQAFLALLGGLRNLGKAFTV